MFFFCLLVLFRFVLFCFVFSRNAEEENGQYGKRLEECKTVPYFIYLFLFFFRFNRDLIIVLFLWSFAGLQFVPYWRSYHGYQQKKGCYIKHQMTIDGEAGLLPVMDGLL